MTPVIYRLFAATAQVNCPSSTANSGGCDTGLPQVTAGNGQLHTVLTIFFGVAAVISVLMIVIGGLMFVTSGGNSEHATRARETIIYAVVGLIVSLSAVGIVQFFLGNL